MSLEKDIAQMDYSEFCEYLNGEGFDRFEIILDYDFFTIYQEQESGRYFYLEESENDAYGFCEMELVACLLYDVKKDIQLKENETLDYLFDCTICGERFLGDRREYLWFNNKNAE